MIEGWDQQGYVEGWGAGNIAVINGQCLDKYGQTNESYAQPIGEALRVTRSHLVLS